MFGGCWETGAGFKDRLPQSQNLLKNVQTKSNFMQKESTKEDQIWKEEIFQKVFF